METVVWQVVTLAALRGTRSWVGGAGRVEVGRLVDHSAGMAVVAVRGTQR